MNVIEDHPDIAEELKRLAEQHRQEFYLLGTK